MASHNTTEADQHYVHSVHQDTPASGDSPDVDQLIMDPGNTDASPADGGDVNKPTSLVLSPTLPCHIPQSDSGICLTPYGQVSVTSPQQDQISLASPQQDQEVVSPQQDQAVASPQQNRQHHQTAGSSQISPGHDETVASTEHLPRCDQMGVSPQQSQIQITLSNNNGEQQQCSEEQTSKNETPKELSAVVDQPANVEMRPKRKPHAHTYPPSARKQKSLDFVAGHHRAEHYYQFHINQTNREFQSPPKTRRKSLEYDPSANLHKDLPVYRQQSRRRSVDMSARLCQDPLYIAQRSPTHDDQNRRSNNGNGSQHGVGSLPMRKSMDLSANLHKDSPVYVHPPHQHHSHHVSTDHHGSHGQVSPGHHHPDTQISQHHNSSAPHEISPTQHDPDTQISQHAQQHDSPAAREVSPTQPHPDMQINSQQAQNFDSPPHENSPGQHLPDTTQISQHEEPKELSAVVDPSANVEMRHKWKPQHTDSPASHETSPARNKEQVLSSDYNYQSSSRRPHSYPTQAYSHAERNRHDTASPHQKLQQRQASHLLADNSASFSSDTRSPTSSGRPYGSPIQSRSPWHLLADNSASFSSDARSPTPSGRPTSSPVQSRSPRHSRHKGSSTPEDDFNYKTKCLVLQFLQQTTSEEHLLYMSQTSLSGTSESERRFSTSDARRLQQRWWDDKCQSSPTSPQPRSKPTPLAKTKGSRSSPNLKDVHFFEDLPEPAKRKVRKSQPPPSKSGRGVKRSPQKPQQRSPAASQKRLSPVQVAKEIDAGLLRSVSQSTENSEYDDDADDELDNSFDSGHKGSVTSISFRNKLTQMRTKGPALSTVDSETENIDEVTLMQADETMASTPDEDSASSIVSLDMINIDTRVVTPNRDFAEVSISEYASQIGDAETVALPLSLGARFDAQRANSRGTNVHHLQVDGDELDSPPFDRLTGADPEMFVRDSVPRGQLPSLDDGMVSGGFELESHDGVGDGEDTEGAWGGVDPDADRERPRGDRTGLRLDLPCLDDPTLYIDAVHALQQEIEEEMSSLDSEFEEGLLCSDNSHSQSQSQSSLHSLSQSRCSSCSQVVKEAAQILAQIGDDVQRRHFDPIESAVGRLLMANCAGLFTYRNFHEAAMMVLEKEDVQGWKQVAVLLMYSQHVALQMAKSGRRGLHRIVNYTVKLLAETTADFIIQQGGYAGLTAHDYSSTPSSPEVLYTDTTLLATPGPPVATALLHNLHQSGLVVPHLQGNAVGPGASGRHSTSDEGNRTDGSQLFGIGAHPFFPFGTGVDRVDAPEQGDSVFGTQVDRGNTSVGESSDADRTLLDHSDVHDRTLVEHSPGASGSPGTAHSEIDTPLQSGGDEPKPNRSDPNPEQASLQNNDREVISNTLPHIEINSPESESSVTKKEGGGEGGGEGTEIGGGGEVINGGGGVGGGGVSSVSNIVTNPSLYAGCAVVMACLAVGATVALTLFRS